ncbi:MAG: hypothetical protein ABI740_09920 [Alphaproteobacteria bacterium]
MPSANKTFALRLQVDNTQQAGAAFKGLATDGKGAFKDIGDGADKAGRSVAKFGVDAKAGGAGLRGLSSIVKDSRAEFESLASRIPLIGGALKEIGPAGLIGAGAFVAIGAAALKTIAVVRQAAAEIAEIGNKAKSLNLGVEAFQALSLAGDQAGVDMTALLEKLRNGIAQAAVGQGDLFNSLRYTNPELLKQLVAAKSLPEAFNLAARATAAATNETDRINIAGGAFGKETGPKAVSVLLALKGGLENYTEAAKAAGQVLDADLVQRVTEANAQFKLLDAQGKVASEQLTVAMLPAVVAVSEAFAHASANLSNFIEGFRPLTDRPLFTVNAQIATMEAGLKEAHRELELFRTSDTANARDQEGYLVKLIEKNQKVLSALYKAKDQLQARPDTPDGGKPAVDNVAVEAANAAAAVAKWTAAIHAADTPVQKIRQQIADLNAVFTLGYVGVDLYAASMKGLNAQLGAQVIKDRAALEKEAADRRAEYGDVTGLVTIKERELNQQVKDGIIVGKSAKEVAETVRNELKAYRDELLDANPALKAQADATRAWTDALRNADPAVSAIADKMDQLLLDFISGNVSLDIYTKNLDKLGDSLVDASVATYAGTPEGKAALALREENKRALEATLTPTQQLAAEQERMNALVGQFPDLAGDAATHMKLYADALKDASDKGLLVNATNELLTETLDGQVTGWKDLERIAVNALVNIAKKALITSQTVQGKANGGFLGALIQGVTGYFTGGSAKSGSTASLVNAETSSGVAVFHSGYQPGDTNPMTRQVPTALFANAPRHHSGLQPHEKAAIIDDREGIFSADHNERLVSAVERMQSMPAPASGDTKVEINIHDESGGQHEVQQSQGPDGMRKVDVYIKRATQNTISSGGADQAMQQRFGLRPVARQR